MTILVLEAKRNVIFCNLCTEILKVKFRASDARQTSYYRTTYPVLIFSFKWTNTKKIQRPYLMTQNAKHWAIVQKQESFAWNSYILR